MKHTENKYKNILESGEKQLEILLNLLADTNQQIDIYAVGGTAMVLAGHKSSTRDIDFFTTNSYQEIKNLFEKIALKEIDSTKACNKWKFMDTRLDIFYSDNEQILGFPLHEKWKENSTHLRKIRKVNLYILNWTDIIATKLARGEERDFEDIIIIIEKENLNFEEFKKHFLEQSEIHAGSFQKGKDNLKYLEKELKRNGRL
ncbi:MAG TPA: DUF6036 family nucleotidyltransferase [Candidatus Nanoarchaeia archaeon]|nr:DUF6036 family nucleotidyltransferase [Candidatus Nanoarchaeia archaeon]